MLEKGPVSLSVAFTNDSYLPDHPDPNQRDRNLLVEKVSRVGPFNQPRPWKPKTHRSIYGDRSNFDHDIEWAADIFSRFGRRAFRRPISREEVQRYLKFAYLARENGVEVEEGIRLGLESMLVSPGFLYREEPQPDPDNVDAVHPVDEHTLASRLSYFFWSTMPDDQLMSLADKGELRKQMDREIDRMIAHGDFWRWIEGFGGQWLQLRDLKHTRLSTKVYKDFSTKLSHDMSIETEKLLRM